MLGYLISDEQEKSPPLTLKRLGAQSAPRKLVPNAKPHTVVEYR